MFSACYEQVRLCVSGEDERDYVFAGTWKNKIEMPEIKNIFSNVDISKKPTV
jgi:hypothetical protein